MLLCHNCGNRVSVNIKVNNLLGNLGFKLSTNTIETCVTSLFPNNIELIATEFYCQFCKEIVSLNNIKLQCSHSGKIGNIDDFIITEILDKETKTRISQRLIYKPELESYKNSVLNTYPVNIQKNIRVKTFSPRIAKTIIRND